MSYIYLIYIYIKKIGNKGGVMISFKIYDTSFCFVNCHLAAKPGRAHHRKANYYELIKKLRTGEKKLEAIFLNDYVFWVGDLNFRLDSNLIIMVFF